MSKVSKAHTRIVIRRFEHAVENYAFRGTIPAGESEYAAQVYDELEIEYARAKKALFNLVDRLNQ